MGVSNLAFGHNLRGSISDRDARSRSAKVESGKVIHNPEVISKKKGTLRHPVIPVSQVE
jgi:hypothetical protein